MVCRVVPVKAKGILCPCINRPHVWVWMNTKETAGRLPSGGGKAWEVSHQQSAVLTTGGSYPWPRRRTLCSPTHVPLQEWCTRLTKSLEVCTRLQPGETITSQFLSTVVCPLALLPYLPLSKVYSSLRIQLHPPRKFSLAGVPSHDFFFFLWTCLTLCTNPVL